MQEVLVDEREAAGLDALAGLAAQEASLDAATAAQLHDSALLPERLRAFALGLDELHRRQLVADRALGSERTADQRRADLIAMLPALALHALVGIAPALSPDGACTRPAMVLNVHVPMATVLGLSSEPATLDGTGPISASPRATAAARRGAARRARRPDDRAAAARRPHAAPSRAAGAPPPAHRRPATDPLCTAPGCSQGAHRSELDHAVPWPTGPTTSRTLTPQSKRCHRAKTVSWPPPDPRLLRALDGPVLPDLASELAVTAGVDRPNARPQLAPDPDDAPF